VRGRCPGRFLKIGNLLVPKEASSETIRAMSRTLSVILAVAIMLIGAALRVILGYNSALIILLAGAGLLSYVIAARDEESDESDFFKNIRGIQDASTAQVAVTPGRATVDLWKELYNERKNIKEELDKLELGPKPPDVPIGAPTMVRMMTQAELHESEEQRRKIERKKQELKLLDEKLVPASNDPRVYPEIVDRTVSGGFFAGTPFVLTSHGGDVAHKCSTESLVFSDGQVTFEVVETIPGAGGKAEMLPTVENAGVLQHRNIKVALRKEWDRAGKLTSEFPVNMRMSYEDFKERKFETSFELVYLPILDIAHEQHPNAYKPTPVLRVRNIKLRRIS